MINFFRIPVKLQLTKYFRLTLTNNPKVQNTPYLLFFLVVILNTACKETYEAPELPNSSSENVEPIMGNFRLVHHDTLTWTEHPFAGLEAFPNRPFSLETVESNFFELENSDSISGTFQRKAIDWENLETKPLNFEEWPKETLQFKVKELGAPKITKAGGLTLNQASSVGVTSVGSDFGIEGNIPGLMKDSKGFIWFGSSNSIIKYDGNNLEFYGSSQGLSLTTVEILFEDSRGLYWLGGPNFIKAIDFENSLVYELETGFDVTLNYDIKEDHQGRIWIANNRVGFTVIDLKENTIRQFTQKEGLTGILSEHVFIDDDGSVLLSTSGGINILDFKEGTKRIIRPEQLMGRPGVGLTAKNNRGDYFFVSAEGINILNKGKDSITFIGKENIDGNFKGLLQVVLDENENVWVGTDFGYLYNIDFKKNVYRSYTLDPRQGRVVYHLVFDGNDQLWAGLVVGGGVYVVDLKDQQPANITPERGLGDPNVWGTLQAQDGKKWIGTYGGIDIIDLEDKSIKHLGVEQGLLDNRNSQLYQSSDGRIWAYSPSVGISIIDQQNRKIYGLSNKNFLNGANPSHLIEWEANKFLLGTTQGQIFIIDLNNNSLRSVQINEPSTTNRIYELIKVDDNHVWVATRDRGTFKLNLDNGLIQKVVGNNIVDINRNFSMLSENGNVWIATLQGIHLLDFSDNSSYTFTIAQGLPANDAYDLVANNGVIYAGTSLGLAIISRNEEAPIAESSWTIQTIGREQGLAHLDFTQNSMSIDENGRIWAGVDSQAFTVIEVPEKENTQTETVITGLTINDQRKDFLPRSEQFFSKGNDTVWATDGLSYRFATEYFESTKTDTSGIKYQRPTGPFNLPEELKLPPDQNFLTFNYHAFQFRDQGNLEYTYFLEGIDRNWSEVTNQTHSENYRDLPPGDYVFKVASKNIYSDWSKPADFSFTILPKWWQTWWAKLLLVLILSVILWSVIWYRSQWLKRENKILEQKVNDRTEQLRNKIEQLKSTQSQLIQSEKMASLGELTAGIAHEIQNPLNFVNNFSEINQELAVELKEELKKGDIDVAMSIADDIRENELKISHHGKRADSIVKGMLQHSRNHSGERVMTDINNLVDEYLRLAYHGMRAKDKTFNASLETDFDLSIEKLIIVPQDIGRVALNIINNSLFAIKEKQMKIDDPTYKPTVWVSTKKENDKISISIKDNGMGIPANVKDKIFQPFFTTKPAGQGTGLGLSMSYDIISKGHGGELLVETEDNIGTTFSIVLPVTQIKLKN